MVVGGLDVSLMRVKLKVIVSVGVASLPEPAEAR